MQVIHCLQLLISENMTMFVCVLFHCKLNRFGLWTVVWTNKESPWGLENSNVYTLHYILDLGSICHVIQTFRSSIHLQFRVYSLKGEFWLLTWRKWKWGGQSTCTYSIYAHTLFLVLCWVLNHQQERNSYHSHCQSAQHSPGSDRGTVGSSGASGQPQPYGRRCSTAVSYSGMF